MNAAEAARADHQRIDAELTPAGWRWTWRSRAGVEHLGGQFHDARARALAAGHDWLNVQLATVAKHSSRRRHDGVA